MGEGKKKQGKVFIWGKQQVVSSVCFATVAQGLTEIWQGDKGQSAPSWDGCGSTWREAWTLPGTQEQGALGELS